MTRRKKSRRSNAKRGFPYRKSDEKAFEDGERVALARYHHDMRDFAKEILEEAKGQFEDYDEAREWIDDRVHETADSVDRVIYTHKALQTLVYSDNWLAVEDVGLESGDDLTRMITVAAFYAVRSDIENYIDAFKDEYFED